MNDKSLLIESKKKVPVEIYDLVDELQKSCEYNLEFYRNDTSPNGVRILAAFQGVKETLEHSRPVIKEVDEFAHEYDFDENTPANGHRSFIYIYNAAVKYTLKLSSYINDNKGSLLFRKQIYVKEMEVCNQMLNGILLVLRKLIECRKISDKSSLFTNENSFDNILINTADEFNQYAFYGRSIGFQFCESMRPIFKFIALMLASYSEAYYSSGIAKATNSMYNGSKYYMDPELCSQRIVNITKSANIEFLKTYWFLGEGKLLQAMPNIVGIKVQINKVFTLPPEDLKVSSEKLGTMVTIKAPSSHTGKRTVHARLLSSHSRSGMVGERQNCFKYDSLPLSKYLIFYVHGGGFCATSSKTYESCLREWADELKVPIFAIDYGLAPEAPFPCGLEDVFYAYCWVLNHPELLGFSGEHIVFAGDSAGANLIASCITKCIENGIKLPDGMLYLYGPSLIKFCTSPSRMMSLIDPLMSHGFLMRCLKAYVGHCKTESSEMDKKFEECKNCEAEIVDDDQEEGLTPTSPNQLNAVWERAQMDTEFNTWQTNLSSIRESTSEDGNMDLLNQPSCSKDDVFEAPKIPTDEKPPKSRSRTPSEDNIVFDVGKDAIRLDSIQKKIQNMTSSIVNAIKSPFGASSSDTETDASKVTKQKSKNILPNTKDEKFEFSIPEDYYLSPYLTPDDILKQFPPVDFMSTHFDPCLDDCVMLAKKMRDLGVTVTIQVFNDTPHGFLNFSRINKECHEGSKACIESLRKLLKMGNGTEVAHDEENQTSSD